MNESAAPRVADRHPGAYSAGLAFERQRSFVVANAVGLVAASAMASLAAVGIAVWMPGSPAVGAFAAGVFVTAAIGYIAHWVSVASGSTMATMGQAAEEWTSTELRRLRRHGWRTINSVMFRQWDVDHVAVGPNGVIVIETKWRSEAIDLSQPDEWLLSAAERLHRSERDVALHLGWSKAKHPDAWITSVLVVWGPKITQPDERPLRSDRGVNVLAGEHLRENLAELTEQVLTSEQIDEVIDRLETQARKRDHPEATTWRTIQDRARHALVVAGVSLGGLYVSLLSTRLSWWFFAAAAVSAAAGIIAMRTLRDRSFGIAWLISTQVVTVAVGAVVLFNLASGT